MEEKINNIFALIHSLWAYRWSAMAISWIIALAGWLVVFAIPNQYSAKATVYIDTASIMKPLLKGLAVDTSIKPDLGVVSKTLLSRDTLLSVIRETDLELQVRDDEERNQLAAQLAKSIVLTSSQNKKRYGRQRQKGDIFEISYTGESAEDVYQVVSRLLDAMIENTLNTSRVDTKVAQAFLDKQIAEYELRLNAAEEKLARFQKENIGFMPTDKGGYYTRLQGALGNVANTKSLLRRERQKLAQLQKQLSGESPILDQNTTGATLRALQQQLADLQSRFTDQHPDVQAIKAKIKDLAENRSNANNIDSDIVDQNSFNPVYQQLKVQASDARLMVGSLQIQLEEQQRIVNELKGSMDAIPQVEAELARLNRDYQVTKKRYTSLVDRRESARLSEEAVQDRSDISFRVINPPIVPSRPAGPNRPLLLAEVLLLALAAGIGWTVLRYMLRPTYADYKQLRERIELPVLGVVSLFRDDAHKRSRRLQLIGFAFSILILFGVFGSTVVFHKTGSALVRHIVNMDGAQV